MTFDDMRRQIGILLGEMIIPNGFEQAVITADKQGRFQNKQILGTLIAIYNYLEANQQHDISAQKHI